MIDDGAEGMALRVEAPHDPQTLCRKDEVFGAPREITRADTCKLFASTRHIVYGAVSPVVIAAPLIQ